MKMDRNLKKRRDKQQQKNIHISRQTELVLSESGLWLAKFSAMPSRIYALHRYLCKLITTFEAKLSLRMNLAAKKIDYRAPRVDNSNFESHDRSNHFDCTAIALIVFRSFHFDTPH